MEAQDWGGRFTLVPVSAPELVLEAVPPGTAPGSAVSIAPPTGADTQIWVVTRREPDVYAIRAASSESLVLAVAAGGTDNGTLVVLETEADKPWQRWTIKANANGSFSLLARHAPSKGLDDFGGGNTPGARQDLWDYNPADEHLQWVLRPLAGATLPAEFANGRRLDPLSIPKGTVFEYDAVGDDYARFLIEELLPFVAREFTLNLSASGNDRCIAGGSSGGIAAFNAAWERPDAFTRVYANSGSFVAFRGGHDFPTLIRKTAAKPIRAYLTTGMHDMENSAGDWYLLDQEMDKALKFAGYDYVFQAIDGPHVAGWNEHFPEAMRFIWKGWPAPVPAGPSAPRVRDVILTAVASSASASAAQKGTPCSRSPAPESGNAPSRSTPPAPSRPGPRSTAPRSELPRARAQVCSGGVCLYSTRRPNAALLRRHPPSQKRLVRLCLCSPEGA